MKITDNEQTEELIRGKKIGVQQIEYQTESRKINEKQKKQRLDQKKKKKRRFAQREKQVQN